MREMKIWKVNSVGFLAVNIMSDLCRLGSQACGFRPFLRCLVCWNTLFSGVLYAGINSCAGSHTTLSSSSDNSSQYG